MNRADRFSIVLGRLVAARTAAGGAPDAIHLTAYADLARRIIATAEAETYQERATEEARNVAKEPPPRRHPAWQDGRRAYIEKRDMHDIPNMLDDYGAACWVLGWRTEAMHQGVKP